MPTKKDNDAERRERIDELVARVNANKSGVPAGETGDKRTVRTKPRPKPRKP